MGLKHRDCNSYSHFGNLIKKLFTFAFPKNQYYFYVIIEFLIRDIQSSDVTFPLLITAPSGYFLAPLSSMFPTGITYNSLLKRP